MKSLPPGIKRNTIKAWFKTNTQGLMLLQLCVYGAIFIVLVIFLVNHPAKLAEWRFYGTVIALASLLILNITWANPRPPTSVKLHIAQQWAFLVSSSALILSIVWMSGQFDAAYLLAILCIQAGFKRGVWPAGLIFGAANLAAWSALLLAMGMPAASIVLVEAYLASGIVFALLATTLLERYSNQTKQAERLLQELQTANLELKAAHQKETDLAIAQERLRLARDIHDGLGHHLTVLSIQLQAASKLAGRDPQAVAEVIEICRSETQAALEDVRHSVSVMRQSPEVDRSLPEALTSLAQSFDRLTGVDVSFELVGSAFDLSPIARQTFYRAVQEGLTNAQKHAQDVQYIDIRLVYEPQSVRLSVRDDGQGLSAEALPTLAGFGLEGLRERVEQLGGVFRSGPGKTRGFELEICIPIRGNSL
jgi:signal transduction histidine kinase